MVFKCRKSSTLLINKKNILSCELRIGGGGEVCAHFSFLTHWNPPSFSLDFSTNMYSLHSRNITRINNTMAVILKWNSQSLRVDECRNVWRTTHEPESAVNFKLVECGRWKERTMQWLKVKQWWTKKNWYQDHNWWGYWWGINCLK
jgi:hypothetical protein